MGCTFFIRNKGGQAAHPISVLSRRHFFATSFLYADVRSMLMGFYYIASQRYAPYFCMDTPYANDYKMLTSDTSLPGCHSYNFKTPAPSESETFYKWFTNIWQPSDKHFANSLQAFYKHSANISQTCHERFTNVLQILYKRSTNVLRTIYKQVTNI